MPDIDERSIGNRSEAGGAESLVKLLANEKADAILEKFYSCTDCSHEEFLITADQVVTFQGRILEKPITTEEAREFISGYSGNCCSTVGSIAVTRLRDKKRVQVVPQARE